MKKLVCSLLIVVMVFSVSVSVFAATENMQPEVKTTASVSPAANTQTTIKFPQSKVYIVKGKKLTVPATGYNAAGKSVKITYRSNKKNIASVSSKGVITARKKGTAKITATGKGVKKAVLTVKVVTSKNKSYGWDKYSIPDQMYVGTVKYASATPWPSTATGIVIKYSSSNKAVATVDTSGRITAKSPGNTRISIKVGSSTVYNTVYVGKAPVNINKTILNQGGVVIKAHKLVYPVYSWDDLKLEITIINNSGQPITVQTREESVNGYMMDFVCSSDVLNGKQIVDNITLWQSDLNRTGISTIRKMEFKFLVCNKNTWDEIFTSTTITLNI